MFVVFGFVAMFGMKEALGVLRIISKNVKRAIIWKLLQKKR